MSRKIFGEFREFFPTGLDSFKIQTKLNLVLLPEFVIQILLEIWTYPQKERCSFFIYHLAEFAKKIGAQDVQRLYFSNRSNFEYWKRFQSWIWAQPIGAV
jgi:hypothetical protein